MNEEYVLTGVLIATAVIAVVAFIVGVIIKYKQDKENATKKKIYVSTLVLTYCGVGTALMNKKELTHTSDTYEKAMKSREEQRDIANKAHQTLASLSDTDIFNFADIVIIHKNQFIAIEQSTYIDYE